MPKRFGRVKLEVEVEVGEILNVKFIPLEICI